MFGRARSFYQENGGYLLAAHLLGLPAQILRNRMLAAKMGVSKLHIGSGAHLRGLSSIRMGEDFAAGDGLWLEAVTHYGEERFTPNLIIGSHVRVSHWAHIACTHSVTIGDHVLIGSKVMITDHNHGSFHHGPLGQEATSPRTPPAERPLERDRFVTIGAKVWLGDGVVVCPGVTMGEGSVAGANAVITADVAPFTLVAGVPARAIRRYDAAQGSWIRV